jgi:hypothetical protein
MVKQRAFQNILISILTIVVGILLCFANSQEILRVVFITMGIIIIWGGITSLFSNKYIVDEKERNISFVISMVTIIVGFLLMYLYNQVAQLIVGVFLVALPIVKIISFKDHKDVLKKELSKIIIGIIVLVCGIGSIMDIILKILGVVVIILSLIYMIYNIYLIIKVNKIERQEIEDSEVIDV